MNLQRAKSLKETLLNLANPAQSLNARMVVPPVDNPFGSSSNLDNLICSFDSSDERRKKDTSDPAQQLLNMHIDEGSGEAGIDPTNSLNTNVIIRNKLNLDLGGTAKGNKPLYL